MSEFGDLSRQQVVAGAKRRVAKRRRKQATEEGKQGRVEKALRTERGALIGDDLGRDPYNPDHVAAYVDGYVSEQMTEDVRSLSEAELDEQARGEYLAEEQKLNAEIEPLKREQAKAIKIGGFAQAREKYAPDASYEPKRRKLVIGVITMEGLLGMLATYPLLTREFPTAPTPVLWLSAALLGLFAAAVATWPVLPAGRAARTLGYLTELAGVAKRADAWLEKNGTHTSESGLVPPSAVSRAVGTMVGMILIALTAQSFLFLMRLSGASETTTDGSMAAMVLVLIAIVSFGIAVLGLFEAKVFDPRNQFLTPIDELDKMIGARIEERHVKYRPTAIIKQLGARKEKFDQFAREHRGLGSTGPEASAMELGISHAVTYARERSAELEKQIMAMIADRRDNGPAPVNRTVLHVPNGDAPDIGAVRANGRTTQ